MVCSPLPRPEPSAELGVVLFINLELLRGTDAWVEHAAPVQRGSEFHVVVEREQQRVLLLPVLFEVPHFAGFVPFPVARMGLCGLRDEMYGGGLQLLNVAISDLKQATSCDLFLGRSGGRLDDCDLEWALDRGQLLRKYGLLDQVTRIDSLPMPELS